MKPSGEADAPRPLFIAFHGTGQDGMSFAASAELQQFVDRGFVVVAPDSNMNGTIWPVWDDMRHEDDRERPNPDLAFADQLIDCLAAHMELDANRVYAGGHSAGGIMTNAFVQRRSELLAGAITGSGVFDLTSPLEAEPLAPTFVIVTWGGPEDRYSGGAGITVPEINFVEQASIASQFYAEQSDVGHARCSYDEDAEGGGHVWLPINGWFADRLLEHPKGSPATATRGEEELPPAPAEGVTCTRAPFTLDSVAPEVFCPAAEMPETCGTACQLMADCAVENLTVGPILAPQLSMLGFSGSDNQQCAGCVERCEEQATTAADEEVLSCLDARAQTSECGGGISGAMPLIDAIESCCDGRDDSGYCVDLCGTILTNDAAASFFPNCMDLVGM